MCRGVGQRRLEYSPVMLPISPRRLCRRKCLSHLRCNVVARARRQHVGRVLGLERPAARELHDAAAPHEQQRVAQRDRLGHRRPPPAAAAGGAARWRRCCCGRGSGTVGVLAAARLIARHRVTHSFLLTAPSQIECAALELSRMPSMRVRAYHRGRERGCLGMRASDYEMSKPGSIHCPVRLCNVINVKLDVICIKVN